MNRSLALLAGLFLLMAAGCKRMNNGEPEDEDMGSSGSTDMATDEPDMTDTGPVLCKGEGCIGAKCTKDTDCTEGNPNKTAVCWEETLLDNPLNVRTLDGYCSRECESDSDCGTGYCFKPAGQVKSYCMARCRNRNTCRHPGYACTFEGGLGMDGICFPDGNLTCNPTAGDCDALIENMGTARGGCIRAAYEDKGICRVACRPGIGTCPKDFRLPSQPAQHCVYLDTTKDAAGRPSATGDKWKGGVCMEYAETQIPEGGKCTYWDECMDGHQCNRYAEKAQDQVCRRLCMLGNGTQDPTLYPGGMPFDKTCPVGTCTDAFQVGNANFNAGLCVP